jgi:hypothetical protein
VKRDRHISFLESSYSQCLMSSTKDYSTSSIAMNPNNDNNNEDGFSFLSTNFFSSPYSQCPSSSQRGCARVLQK